MRRRVLGGMEDVDFLTRSHVFLLRALSLLLNDDPAAREWIRVELVGNLSDADRRVVDEFAYRDLVYAPGYLPHADVVDLLRSAHVLFLPMHDMPLGRRARIVPGKIYEYLASGTPILGAVPDGDARDLLEATGSAVVCRPSDTQCISASIAKLLQEHRTGGIRRKPHEAIIRRYDRRMLTHELARLFDEVLGGRPITRHGLGAGSAS